MPHDLVTSAARDHAAYRWSPQPRAGWTPEQNAQYAQAYASAQEEPQNTSYHILITPPKVYKNNTPRFHTVSARDPEVAQRIFDDLYRTEQAKPGIERATLQLLDLRQAREAAQKLGIKF